MSITAGGPGETVTRRLISMAAGDSDAGARAEHARERLATLGPRERDRAAAGEH